MSDIEKAILDAIGKKITGVDEKEINPNLTCPLTAKCNYRLGLIAAEQIVIDAFKESK